MKTIEVSLTTLDNSLDAILIHLGEFGRYQSIVFCLVCFGVVLHSGVHIAFVFTAFNLEYRCAIPECDAANPKYNTSWLKNAVPFNEEGIPSKCSRYQINNATSDFKNCNKSSDFNRKKEIRCHSFVYKSKENSIVKEYDLQCNNNLWKLGFVGSINSIGQFCGLFVAGLLSDRFGRRVVFILGMFFCGVCGITRTLSPTYWCFLIFEFLDAACGSGSYICGFILGVELVGPKRRVLIGTFISSCYAVGEVFAAGSAWLLMDWRYIILVLYGPCLLLIFYFWLIPESIRWNLSKGRSEPAKKTLRRLAKMNKREITEEILDRLSGIMDEEHWKTSFVDLFSSTKLVLRLINCCFCWITCAFLFYGLTLNSVALAGNSYADFIYTSLVEVPAYFTCIFIVEKLGRKWSLSGAFFLTGISCLVFIFIPKSTHHAASLSVYLIGKFGATIAFTVAYLITSELFPTPLRHSVMGVCSSFGRIGSMIAPHAPFMAHLWTPLPLVLFTAMAVAAGLLTFLFPETVDIKLPDTIEEAVNIGIT